MFCVDKMKYMYEHLAILSNLKSCQFEDLQIISPKIIPLSHRNI